MANILEQYGIKEVCNATFYELGTNIPKLYISTAKVSSYETTAEQTDSRGGYGNPKLITWDYNKDITVNLEDALFTMRSLEVMFGGTKHKGEVDLYRTISFVATAEDTDLSVCKQNHTWIPVNGDPVKLSDTTYIDGEVTIYDADGSVTAVTAGNVYYATFKLKAANKYIIDITPNKFPDAYKFVADTFIRSKTTLKDEPSTPITKKVKINSENTIELSADGDPATFNMSMTALQSDDGDIMQLIKYDLGN